MLVIKYFGNRVNSVGGVWEVNPIYVNGISDNLVSYRNALIAGKTAVEAAFLTSTGKWEQKKDFTKVDLELVWDEGKEENWEPVLNLVMTKPPSYANEVY